MNGGRGSLRAMLKVYGKRTAFGRSSLLCASLLIVLGLGFVLTGCGQLSLSQLLENEEPGVFDVSPNDANIAVNTEMTITGAGGFKPYIFEKVAGIGTIDAESGVYLAPPSVTGDYQEADIQTTDFFGKTALTTLKVFNPLSLNVDATTVLEGGNVNFDADGGVPGYSFYVDGSETPIVTSADGIWNSTWPTQGVYLVEVVDSIGNGAVSTVTVLTATGTLAIDPESVSIAQSGVVHFTGINLSGMAEYSHDPALGTLTAAGDDAQYTAPDNFTGIITVRLEDSFDASVVTAKVYVYDPLIPPEALSISPSTVHDDLRFGETLVFTAAGGLLPYAFSIDPDDFTGTLEKIDFNKARYTAPSGNNTVDWIRLTDGLGTPRRVRVKVKG